MTRDIIICGTGVLSALGQNFDQSRKAFSSDNHFFERRRLCGAEEWVAPLHASQERVLQALTREHSLLRDLDRSVLMAIAAARGARTSAQWQEMDEVGVVLGSSRGATSTFEAQYGQFRDRTSARVEPVTSPTTTLGNLSTAVAQDLLCDGIECSHSITCSTALHGIVNAVGWIRAGMGTRFLVGGSEAALTDFTIAQMKALRIYTSREDQAFPCRPLDPSSEGQNTFALGEGAAVFAISEWSESAKHRALARIEGLGWGMEPISSLTSMSLRGTSFIRSMQRALSSRETNGDIDLIIGHAPGTVMGDRSELAAVHEVFGEDAPLVVSPKWQIGHTFGASGAFGILYALALLSGTPLLLPAYRQQERGRIPGNISRVLINAAGFGGNSCSIILSRVEK